MCLEYDEKLKVCAKQLAEEFGIPSHTAWTIINNLDLSDKMFDIYAEQLKEAEEKRMAEWEREIQMNPDLYLNDIHGGI